MKDIERRLRRIEGMKKTGSGVLRVPFKDGEDWQQTAARALQAAPPSPEGHGYLVVPELPPDQWEQYAREEMARRNT